MRLARASHGNAAFRAGEIEAWGRGIQRIQEACRQADTPEPQIAWESGELLLTFPFGADYLAALAGEADEAAAAGAGLGKATQKTTQNASAKSGAGLGKGLGKGLGETAQAIIAAMQARPTITIPELAQTLDISTTAVEKQLKTLREAGHVQRVGGRKHGHWEVLE